ncbi:MAG: undecaprenyl/decaprenyl-phosphate alpha-N-acetylglucosaminyl 1-phosphate transferase [Treponema sp.]|nr:undecaprenyl/decaprenyl-phosphate alpha-N-acetylglucosaminyl 1-phosphate transferase [Treponema sp.]
MLVINLLYFATALVISIILEFCTINFSAKHNLYDSVDERKIHSGNISRLGGFGFMVPFIVLGLFCFIRFAMKDVAELDNCSVWGLLACAAIIYVSGTVDDIKDLNPWIKLGLQILAIVVCYGFFAFQFRNEKFSILNFSNFSIISLFVLALVFVFFIGTINAYNLIDGSDLLSSCVSIFVIFSLGWFLKDTDPVLFTLTVILCGGILGFMIFNKPNAKIFMGDGGSQSLGIIIAYLCLMVIARSKSPILSHLICMNFVALPCIDTIAAIWRRMRQHVGIFTADKFHMHHKLLALGCKKWGIAIVVSLVQIIVCALAFVSWNLKDTNYCLSVAIQCVTFAGIVAYFAVLHYRAHKVVDVK